MPYSKGSCWQMQRNTCAMCYVHIAQTNDAGTNAICFTETVAVQDWKQLASNQNSLMLRKEFRNIFFVKTVVTHNWTGDFFWKHCNVQKEFEFRATLVTIHMICKNTIFKKQLTIEVNWFLRRRKLRFSRQIRFLSSTVNNLIYKNRWGRLLRTVGLRWELEELDKSQINPNP